MLLLLPPLLLLFSLTVICWRRRATAGGGFAAGLLAPARSSATKLRTAGCRSLGTAGGNGRLSVCRTLAAGGHCAAGRMRAARRTADLRGGGEGRRGGPECSRSGRCGGDCSGGALKYG